MAREGGEGPVRREELLVSRLKDYAQTDMLPLHMPGHKRKLGFSLTGDFPDPFGIDITEVEGFDNLHHPEGILKRSMEWAAGVYGADMTRYLVNGSSGGILSAVSAAVQPGGKLLMSRNCHKSAYHAAVINRLEVGYIYPQMLDDLGIQGGILPSDVENALKQNPDAEAALVVSPTYDGIVSDIRAIAEVVHRHGIPLIVDEAHGAHFSFGGRNFPESALSGGADIVIQSVHKTLPSLTQTALLHARRGLVDMERLAWFLQVYQSSSPSYVLMASIEQCIYEMERDGARHMEAFAGRLETLRRRLKGLSALRLLDEAAVGKSGVYDIDRSKLVISCGGCGGMNGELLGEMLRDEYHIEMEMCGADYVVGITTWMDGEKSLDRLADALLAIDKRLCGRGRHAALRADDKLPLKSPEVAMRLSDALGAKYEAAPLSECAGRVSTEFICLYPPGIPIVAPGERVTEEIARRVLRWFDMGLPVQGMAEGETRRLRVAAL